MDYFNDIDIFKISRMITSCSNTLTSCTRGALGLMLRGPAILCMGTERKLLEAPFLYWSPPGLPGAWITPRGVERENLWLIASGERFERILASLDRLAPERHIPFPKPANFIEVFERMHNVYARNTIADQHLLPLLMEELLYEIRKALAVDPVSDRLHAILRQMVDRITEAPGLDFDLPAFAENHQLSVDYLRRCFFKYTGTPVYDFILNQRYAMAIRLLRETNMAISQISDACGFAHQGDFTRFFKKRSHLSPRNFRNDEIILF